MSILGRAFENHEPAPKRLANVHPGDVLQEEFLRPLGISAARFGRAVGMSPASIQDIVRGKTALTMETARSFATYFDTSVVFWLNLQGAYDAEEGKEAKRPD